MLDHIKNFAKAITFILIVPVLHSNEIDKKLANNSYIAGRDTDEVYFLTRANTLKTYIKSSGGLKQGDIIKLPQHPGISDTQAAILKNHKIWIRGEDGIYYLKNNSWEKYQDYPTGYSKYIAETCYSAFSITDSGNIIYIGTPDNLIEIYDHASNKNIKSIAYPNSKSPGWGNIHFSYNKNLIFGYSLTFGKSFIFDENDGSFQVMPLPIEMANIRSHHDFKQIFIIPDHKSDFTIIFDSNAGVCSFKIGLKLNNKYLLHKNTFKTIYAWPDEAGKLVPIVCQRGE